MRLPLQKNYPPKERMMLLDRTVPYTNSLLDGTVPSTNSLLDRTVASTN